MKFSGFIHDFSSKVRLLGTTPGGPPENDDATLSLDELFIVSHDFLNCTPKINRNEMD